MDYQILNIQEFKHKNYKLVPFREMDLMKIRVWRNEQMEVLRQKRKLSETDQKNYFKNVILPLFDQAKPPQLLFSFLLDDICIGYGGLVHINWEDRRGEVSFLVDAQRALNPETYQEDFQNYLKIIKKIAFEALLFNRIYTETFDIRDFHISILEAAGFRLEGRMKEHVLINEVFYDSLIHGFTKNYYNDER